MEEDKCVFWEKNDCYWSKLRQKDIKENIICGGLPFKLCKNGTGKYNGGLNTTETCNFFK